MSACRPSNMTARALPACALPIVLVGALAAACASQSGFGLSSEDNNPQRLAQALARHTPSTAGAPRNALGKPLAFLVARAHRKQHRGQQLIAFDLADKSELWRVETSVASRVVVSRDVVVHLDDQRRLVARDVASGQTRWTAHPKKFLGATADAERIYYVSEDRTGDRPVWFLVALSARDGAELWRRDAPGSLGVPAAQGGLVFSPFMKQWLAILDANTGAQLTRIRGVDEEISFVRATGAQVYFGSKSGVFALDERAASGRRAESTYGRVQVPEAFARAHYYWDAFDRVQAGYSAYDRNRLLWRGQTRGDQLGFADDRIIAYTYRFFFGFDSTEGTLRWAYSHPRFDAVGAAHVGPAIAFASGLGELGALDPHTGQRIYAARIDEQLVGVTFDAEGWAPDEASTPTSTVTALAAIARDRDARFGHIKRFAVAALASLPGADATRDLLDLIDNDRTPEDLRDKAVDVLISRRDAEGLPYLIAALETRYDAIAGTGPRHVDVVARAIGALGREPLEPDQRRRAVDALVATLQAPQTPMDDLDEVIGALGAVGQGAEIAPLASFVLAYRADPRMAEHIAAMHAAIDALLYRGGPAARELIGFVAEDPRTRPRIAAYARRALTPLRARRRVQKAEKAQ